MTIAPFVIRWTLTTERAHIAVRRTLTPPTTDPVTIEIDASGPDARTAFDLAQSAEYAIAEYVVAHCEPEKP